MELGEGPLAAKGDVFHPWRLAKWFPVLTNVRFFCPFIRGEESLTFSNFQGKQDCIPRTNSKNPWKNSACETILSFWGSAYFPVVWLVLRGEKIIPNPTPAVRYEKRTGTRVEWDSFEIQSQKFESTRLNADDNQRGHSLRSKEIHKSKYFQSMLIEWDHPFPALVTTSIVTWYLLPSTILTIVGKGDNPNI